MNPPINFKNYGGTDKWRTCSAWHRESCEYRDKFVDILSRDFKLDGSYYFDLVFEVTFGSFEKPRGAQMYRGVVLWVRRIVCKIPRLALRQRWVIIIFLRRTAWFWSSTVSSTVRWGLSARFRCLLFLLSGENQVSVIQFCVWKKIKIRICIVYPTSQKSSAIINHPPAINYRWSYSQIHH